MAPVRTVRHVGSCLIQRSIILRLIDSICLDRWDSNLRRAVGLFVVRHVVCFLRWYFCTSHALFAALFLRYPHAVRRSVRLAVKSCRCALLLAKHWNLDFLSIYFCWSLLYTTYLFVYSLHWLLWLLRGIITKNDFVNIITLIYIDGIIFRNYLNFCHFVILFVILSWFIMSYCHDLLCHFVTDKLSYYFAKLSCDLFDISFFLCIYLHHYLTIIFLNLWRSLNLRKISITN